MDRDKIKAYRAVAEIIATSELKSPILYPFTCNELYKQDKGACRDYKKLYFLPDISDCEDDMWEDTDYLTERRLLMLCLAAAIEEAGGL